MRELNPTAIETEVFFREKLNHLRENPVRKGFVELPEDWKFSSAWNYTSGGNSIIKVECL
jgi:REP-associated tyrosine transposase